MKASIILVTRNRAADLQLTLESLRGIRVPAGLEAELLVVDNASTDDTAAVVGAHRISHVKVRSVREDQPGKANGCNRALAETTGELIFFVDDDVRVPADWLAAMAEPMVQNKASVVAGGVRIAPGLLRTWMTPYHRSFLASTEWMRPEAPHSLVGANMAFSREVLRRVPGFDPELGPGALGFGEEELFALQLLEAGYKIFGRLDMCVEHHFDPSRLRRESWVNSGYRRGRINAYLTYHWHHRGYRAAVPRLLVACSQLTARRVAEWGRRTTEGCSERELRLLYRCGELREYLRLRNTPRKYEFHGLAKLSR